MDGLRGVSGSDLVGAVTETRIACDKREKAKKLKHVCVFLVSPEAAPSFSLHLTWLMNARRDCNA